MAGSRPTSGKPGVRSKSMIGASSPKLKRSALPSATLAVKQVMAVGVPPQHGTDMDPFARMAIEALGGRDDGVAVLVDRHLRLADQVRDREEIGPRAARRRINTGKLLGVLLCAAVTAF